MKNIYEIETNKKCYDYKIVNKRILDEYTVNQYTHCLLTSLSRRVY